MFGGHIEARVLVCITPQSNSLRLIKRGWEISEKMGGSLAILNVERGESICTNPQSAAMLQRLFDYAMEFGGSVHALSIPQDASVAQSILKFIRAEKITHLLLGQSGGEAASRETGLIEEITSRLPYIKVEILYKEQAQKQEQEIQDEGDDGYE